MLADVEPEDLIKFGLIPEFVGRLPVVATLEELDEAALVKILTQPKNAISKQFKKLFEIEGAELEFRNDALLAVAHKALKRKTGARGLRTILESVLLDTMYELPSLQNVTKVVVDESVIENGNAEPYLIYRGIQSRAAARAVRMTYRRFVRPNCPDVTSSLLSSRHVANAGARRICLHESCKRGRQTALECGLRSGRWPRSHRIS